MTDQEPIVLKSAPSWFYTAKIIKNLMVFGNLDIFGEYQAMSAGEKRGMFLAVTALRFVAAFIVVLLVVLAFATMLGSALAGLINLMVIIVGVPGVMITAVWLGLKTILPSEDPNGK